MSYWLHPAAEAEHLEAVAFYETRRAGLGDSYLSDFEQTMARIVEAPQRWRIERKPDVRRLSFDRFPYTVIYRERAGSVEVLAVSHKQKRPGYWRGRI